MNFPTIDRSFFAGECFDAYRVLGAHPCRDDFGQEGWRFAVWAPGPTEAFTSGQTFFGRTFSPSGTQNWEPPQSPVRFK